MIVRHRLGESFIALNALKAFMNSQTLQQLLDTRVAAALAAAGCEGASAIIAPAGRPEFGDYQANGCMAWGKPSPNRDAVDG